MNQEFKRLEAASTPAPWYMDQPAGGFSAFRDESTRKLLIATASPLKECPNAEADHALLLWLRNSAPAIFAQLAAVTAEQDALAACIADAHERIERLIRRVDRDPEWVAHKLTQIMDDALGTAGLDALLRRDARIRAEGRAEALRQAAEYVLNCADKYELAADLNRMACTELEAPGMGAE